MKPEKRRTRLGLISTIYSEQKQSSKQRNHPAPGYSKDALIEFILEQPSFEGLYRKWVNSGYDTWKRPSIDRIDNKKPYVLNNIRLVTFKENNEKSHEDAREGAFVDLRPVDKYDLKGNLLESYKSISDAARINKISTNTIFYGCNKKKYAAKEFMWKYSEDTHTPQYIKNTRKYQQYDGNGDVLFSSNDLAEIRKYLKREDLSPLNKAIRRNRKYLGYKWTAYHE
jgi:hypothetical protein